MKIKDAIQTLVAHTNLSQDEAHEVGRELMSGTTTDAQIGAFLTALRMKGETVDEITGMALVMRENATSITTQRTNIIDTCGTGGDSSGTFNISTAAALVAAGAGVVVAKHGNRSVSSSCGSADVLKELGVNLEATPAQVGTCIDKVGIGFMFAPLMHSTMKYVIGPRRELAMRTIFNILGPLTNPAGAKRQVLGVFDPKLAEPLAQVLKKLGSEQVMVVNGGGLDEISLSGPTNVAELKAGKVTTSIITPEDYGITRAPLETLTCTTVAECAEAVQAVLQGTLGPRRDIVLLNAGAAIYISGMVPTLAEGVVAAAGAIDDGRALKTLQDLVTCSNQ